MIVGRYEEYPRLEQSLFSQFLWNPQNLLGGGEFGYGTPQNIEVVRQAI